MTDTADLDAARLAASLRYLIGDCGFMVDRQTQDTYDTIKYVLQRHEDRVTQRNTSAIASACITAE